MHTLPRKDLNVPKGEASTSFNICILLYNHYSKHKYKKEKGNAAIDIIHFDYQRSFSIYVSLETNFSHDRGYFYKRIKGSKRQVYTNVIQKIYTLKKGYNIFKVKTQQTTNPFEYLFSKIALGNQNVHTERVKVILSSM